MNDTPKRDRRLEAQKHAAELRLQEQRRARRRGFLIGGGAVVAVLAVAGVIAGVVLNGESSTSAPGAAGSASTAPASASTWAAPADVEGAVRAAGLQMLSAEGSALHIHQHLSVTVDGAPVAVPAGIGIDEAQQHISPIHTHDESGIIHVESAEVRTFTLAQVFDEWGQKLGPGQVGAYRDGADGHTVTVFVDGKTFTGDPRTIPLTSHEDIDIVVAKKGTTATAPKAFAWPAGY
ncbi:hypothetical protein [Leifsonia sp. EB34]|uniref:hypothetical protein n=1 Tax=Leifsonia sp. EB34 TaxID=3156303 RepID=UPI0035183457